jgi:hypothetical protein
VRSRGPSLVAILAFLTLMVTTGCQSNRSTPPASSQASTPLTNSVAPTTEAAICSYQDAGNGKTITAAKGSTLTDSRGYTYRVNNHCGLTQLKPAACAYLDAGNRKPITAARGSTFTDSRGYTYRVNNHCGLTQVRSPHQRRTRPANGHPTASASTGPPGSASPRARISTRG